MKHASIKIHGLVQGVYFRYYTVKRAKELDIYGWVRNETDNSVHIEAEGEERNLKEFIAWCHEGSPSAQPKKVDCNFSTSLKNFNDFEIKL
jgi:acylphosphatase